MQISVNTKPIRIALIGSRKLEEISAYKPFVDMYFEYCYQLAKAGVVMTSGLCKKGPDGLAQKAYAKAIDEGLADVSQLEVYVYDQSEIIKSPLPYKSYAIVMPDHLRNKRIELLRTVMTPSHIEACGPYALGMHQRNVHQILGLELNNPVDAVICWTPNGDVVGGTATALKLAMKADIPIFNLGRPDQDKVLEEIRQFLLERNVVGVK